VTPGLGSIITLRGSDEHEDLASLQDVNRFRRKFSAADLKGSLLTGRSFCCQIDAVHFVNATTDLIRTLPVARSISID
jgi:hypothetical protein